MKQPKTHRKRGHALWRKPNVGLGAFRAARLVAGIMATGSGLAMALATIVAPHAHAQPDFEHAPDRRNDWRRVITTPDLGRIRNWREAMVRGLTSAQQAGFAPQINALGPLLALNARVERVDFQPGAYRCRMVWLGNVHPGAAVFSVGDFTPCRMALQGGKNEAQHFRATDGKRRFAGYFYNDGPDRRVFLGSLIFPGESVAMNYDQDDTRDIVGFVERIGDRRWRMILPYPRTEALVKVMEIIPE